jgi:phosphoribosyl 1,2-cyclic phosphodiesterase
MALEVKLWGVRGSIPSPKSLNYERRQQLSLLNDFVQSKYFKTKNVNQFIKNRYPTGLSGYGGNTACIEVKTEKTQLIVDGGSGLRELGYEIMQQKKKGEKLELHILFTHFHWDHLVGLPFFIPFYLPDATIHLYAVQDELEYIMRTVFKKPFFPVPFEELGAKIIFHKLAERKKTKIGDIHFTPYELDHPDPCWGFRFEHKKKVVSYCVDSECHRISRDELGPDLPLYQGVDVLIFDAQYSFDEYMQKVNWGHSSSHIGLEIALRENIKRVYFMHHDPEATDEDIDMLSLQTQMFYDFLIEQNSGQKKKLPKIDWSFAQEGMVIKV